MKDILTIGDKIDIKLASIKRSIEAIDSEEVEKDKVKGLGTDKGQYVSQLLDFVESDTINIAMPMSGNKMIALRVMGEYNLCFYTKKSLYQCNGIVMERHQDKNIHYATVKLSTNIEKFQRRQYYRLQFVMDVLYRSITN